MPKTVAQTLDDPDFGKLSPEVQKAVLGKLGVSEGMQGKVLAKIAAPAAAKSSAKPAGDFFERSAERFKQNVMAVPHALDVYAGLEKPVPGEAEGYRHMIGADSKTKLGRITGPLTMVPRMLYGMGKDYLSDPSKLVGDVATGALLSKVGAPEVADTAEARAMQSASRATSDAATTEATVRTPGRQIRETAPAVPENLRHLSPEARAKYTAKLDAANLEHEAKLAEAAQKETAERGMNVATRDVQNNLMATHKAVRASLDTRWNVLRETMRGTEVGDPATIYNGIQEAEAEYLRGSPQNVQQFRNLVRELGIKDFAEREDGTLEAAPVEPGTGKPLDWETARVHSTAIGDKLASGGLPGNVYQALKHVKGVMESALGKAAEAKGVAEQYTNLKLDWSTYMRDWQDMSAVSQGGSPIARVLKSPDAGYARGHITGKAGERMAQTLERYRQYGAKPELVNGVREMHRVSKLPRIKPVPVPVPVEAAAKKPFLKKLFRIGGGVSAAAASSALPPPFKHPVVAFFGGEQAGEAIYDRLLKPPPKP